MPVAQRAGQSITADVLITVKTYPNPSVKHQEIVCTAGARIDGDRPSWIRLYPVQFRTRGDNEQFRKYEVIRLDAVSRAPADSRVESYSPAPDSIQRIRQVDTRAKWARRRDLLSSLVGETTTCNLRASATAKPMSVPAPSLGLIKPRVSRVVVSRGLPWSADQLAKVKQAAAPSLFGDELQELEPAPYDVRYEYKCMTSECRGHAQKVLDWELGQAGRRWRREKGDTRAISMVKEKWENQFLDPSLDLHFYIGNQHLHRQSFSVLGCWYPPADDQLGLF
ncbi:hypothetical protein CH274_14650 [Rhodococcus sp. 06-418-5]|nr:hypothetical protein CH274_14650 [Rhodococcus sp. 06-418-5]